jgi:hypothetical protein
VVKPIAEKPAELPEILCVEEVRLGIPQELLPQVREFYTDLIGLPPWPRSEQIPGGWGVGNPARGLYLQYRHDPHVDPIRRRFTVLVADLPEIIARLTEREWAFEHYRSFGGIDEWLILADPVGHLIEIRASHRAL